MLGVTNNLNPLDMAEAKIQSYVAEFLANKVLLIQMSQLNIVTIRDEAKRLYNQQLILEKALNENLALIESFKRGTWTFSDVLKLTAFATSLGMHNQQVRKLRQQAGILPINTSIDWQKWLLYGGIGYLIYKIIK